jgi:hypothetical protein
MATPHIMAVLTREDWERLWKLSHGEVVVSGPEGSDRISNVSLRFRRDRRASDYFNWLMYVPGAETLMRVEYYTIIDTNRDDLENTSFRITKRSSTGTSCLVHVPGGAGEGTQGVGSGKVVVHEEQVVAAARIAAFDLIRSEH